MNFRRVVENTFGIMTNVFRDLGNLINPDHKKAKLKSLYLAFISVTFCGGALDPDTNTAL